MLAATEASDFAWIVGITLTGLLTGISGVVIAVINGRAAREAAREAAAASYQLKPANGTPLAETIEALAEDMKGVKQDLAYHVTVQHGRGPIQD